MVFRLPTHLESLVPPPSEQVPQPRPWRGTFVLNTADGNHKGVQEISLTAVETDGDKYVQFKSIAFFSLLIHTVAGQTSGLLSLSST